MTNDQITLSEGRLELAAATEELLKLELAHSDAVFSHLGATKPPYWPPDLNDDDSFGFMLEAIKANSSVRNWGLYYALDVTAERTLVGCGGYVGAPTPDGTVELGYSILAPYRRQGYATAMCRLLIKEAFRSPQVRAVIARTYPHLMPSIGVLTKLGFTLVGEDAEGIVTYRLTKP